MILHWHEAGIRNVSDTPHTACNHTIHQTGVKPFDSGSGTCFSPSTWNVGSWVQNTSQITIVGAILKILNPKPHDVMMCV